MEEEEAEVYGRAKNLSGHSVSKIICIHIHDVPWYGIKRQWESIDSVFIICSSGSVAFKWFVVSIFLNDVMCFGFLFVTSCIHILDNTEITSVL